MGKKPFKQRLKKGLILRAKIIVALAVMYFIAGFAIEASNMDKGEKDLSFYENYVLEKDKLPIFYRDEYNISFMGLEKLHPFDSQKYGRVFSYLKEKGVLDESKIVSPHKPQKSLIESFHSAEYLESLKGPINLTKILEIAPVALFPWQVTHKQVLSPMLYATGGTLMASKAAIQKGWAINLGGGYHHASNDQGSGFCVYADITMSIKTILKTEYNIKKVLYIDLDVHQGNGPERDFLGDDRVLIMDVYNRYIFPGDTEAKKAIDMELALGYDKQDSEYLPIIEKNLEKLLDEKKIDFIFYNAGTDIMSGDPLGAWDISDQGVIKRDEIVFKAAKKRGIPIVMVLSGGYQKKNAKVIADSIENIMRLVL
jgi:histone deacetylase 11